MPKLVDTTIRLLSQEPLAGRLPTAEVLRVAEILDRPASRASRSPAEVSSTPPCAAASRAPGSASARSRAASRRRSGIALRGRFLVGSRPVSGDIVGRFVSCAAENGIDVFRLHDPLNDVSNLREAGAAITSAGGAFHAGLVYSPGRTGETETDTLVEQARKLPELGATRILVNDPTGALVPHRAQELVVRLMEASGLPVGFYVQGAAGIGLASALAAVDSGADLIATAVYPLALTLHRVSGESVAESLQGLGHATGLDVDKLWEAADVIDEWIGDEPVAPVAPRIAVRAAEYDLPAGLVAALDVHLRAHAAADRLLEVLEEVGRVRAEAGWPPLAAPIGQILASQALLHVLEARRYGSVIDEFRELVQGGYGVTPEPVDPTVERAVGLLAPARSAHRGPGDDGGRARAGGGARGERGGARPHRDVRLGRRGAAQGHPRAPFTRFGAHRRGRGRRARRADPRAREDRAGVGRRGDRDRGRGHARVRPARRRVRSATIALPVGDEHRARKTRLLAAPSGRRDARRVADGRRLLPRAEPGSARVRRRRGHRRSRARCCASSRR